MADLSDLTVQSLFNLKGWVAVVTGGGTGLGLMTARALAANGAKVYITGRRSNKLKDAELHDSSSGGSIIAVQMDCTSKQAIQSGVQQIAQKEKHVNLLVNNAGIVSIDYGAQGPPTGSVQEISDRMLNEQTFDDWTNVYKINVASYYFTSAAFLPLLCAARSHGFPEAGSILNISSVSGLTSESQNGQFGYNASKAACISLTEQLATDFARPEIEVRVNSIAPGYFPSEMTSVEKDKDGGKEFFRNKWGVPFGRAGNARDYAQAVLSLAVNQYVTGSTLKIDGGYMLVHA